MRQSLILVMLTLPVFPAGPTTPSIKNGVITWTDRDGRQRPLNVGSKCADLWVSPDGEIIAFIALGPAVRPGGPVLPGR